MLICCGFTSFSRRQIAASKLKYLKDLETKERLAKLKNYADDFISVVQQGSRQEYEVTLSYDFTKF